MTTITTKNNNGQIIDTYSIESNLTHNDLMKITTQIRVYGMDGKLVDKVPCVGDFTRADDRNDWRDYPHPHPQALVNVAEVYPSHLYKLC